MLELVGALVVARFGALLAEQHRLLVQKDVPVLGFEPQPEVLFALRPHLERVLQQQFALLGQIGLRGQKKKGRENENRFCELP